MWLYEKDNKKYDRPPFKVEIILSSKGRTKDQGFVLVLTLLYLSIITLLVNEMFTDGVMQTRIAINHHQSAIAWQNAESALMMGESQIKTGIDQGQGSLPDQSGDYKFNLDTVHQQCGFNFYQVTANGIYLNAKVSLQSLWALPNGSQFDCPDAAFMPHRVYWDQPM